MFRPLGPFLLPLLLVLVSRAVFAAMIPFASEDAYITFRYARNFSSGNGLVFNPGEHVMGFSSPLWTLWCSIGTGLLSQPVLWTRVTAILADLAVVLVLGQVLRRHAGTTAAWCFNAFFAAWPYFSAVAVSGMENGILFALIVLAAVLAERRSPATGPALAAVALCRPEGLVAAALLALGARRRDALIALGLVAAAAAGLTAYYGSPLPQSMLAKAKLYGTPGPWLGRHWWEWLSPAPLGRWPDLAESSFLVPLSLLLAPAAVLGARDVWKKRGSALFGVAAASIAIFAGYALLGVAYFWWYLAAPLAGVALLASVGLPRMTRGPALYASLALMLAGMWSMQPRLYLGRAQNEYAGFARAAQILRSEATPGQKVLLEPIGFIGFAAPLVVVDEVGLVSPHVMQRRLRGAGWYADVVARDRPDWLVVRGSVFTSGESFAGAGAPFRGPQDRDAVLSRYTRFALADSMPGSAGLLIYRRRP